VGCFRVTMANPSICLSGIRGSEPDGMTRLVPEHDQPHIPLAAVRPNSAACRGWRSTAACDCGSADRASRPSSGPPVVRQSSPARSASLAGPFNQNGSGLTIFGRLVDDEARLADIGLCAPLLEQKEFIPHRRPRLHDRVAGDRPYAMQGSSPSSRPSFWSR
jgi:hypothetical protein